MRERVERWTRAHPNAAAVLTVLLACGIVAFGVVRLVHVWDGVSSALLFVVGVVVGGTAAVLSYRAGYVDRWQVSDELRAALKGMQALSWVAALAAIRGWGPGWLISLACGFVVAIGMWLVPATVLGRRTRVRDPHAADELLARSKEVMR